LAVEFSLYLEFTNDSFLYDCLIVNYFVNNVKVIENLVRFMNLSIAITKSIVNSQVVFFDSASGISLIVLSTDFALFAYVITSIQNYFIKKPPFSYYFFIIEGFMVISEKAMTLENSRYC
jgi:hypothetical protein